MPLREVSAPPPSQPVRTSIFQDGKFRMKTPDGRNPSPGPRPSGVDVTLAVARERIAEAHLSSAMGFIEFTAEDLAPPRALSIYGRLQNLSEDEFRIVKNRVLASYGNQSGPEVPPPSTFVAVNGDVEWDVTASLFNRIRKRLAGRRNYRLRRRVELYSGHVEAIILRIHVDSVCRLVPMFEQDMGISDIVRLYIEELDVRRTLYHAIYVAALEQLYGEMEGKLAGDAAAAEAAPAAEPRPLRMVPDRARRSG